MTKKKTYEVEKEMLITKHQYTLDKKLKALRDKYDWGRQLIQHALSLNYQVGFDDPDSNSVHAVYFPQPQALDHLWNVATEGESVVRVYFFERVDGQLQGKYWALLVHGNDPDETINDYVATSSNGRTWIDIWWELKREEEEGDA